MACPSCQETNDASQHFCGACGSPLTTRCRACDVLSPPGFRFCGQCGAPLQGVSPPTTLREERRWATVVFADLSGFTSLSERADPEDVRELVDGCVARMAAVVAAHGGWFDKVMGDGILAVFGAERAHGDDAERATRAALELRRQATEHAEAFGGLTLSIGVNTGELMFAAVGPDGRREQTVIGDAVNTAARLQSAAPPGTILVGEETWRVTRSIVRYEPVSPVQAKGKSEPVRAWAAVDVIPLEVDRPLSEVPMVGRSAEMTLLRSTWERAVRERRPHLVTVLGPAGIGKTKLARELARDVEVDGSRVLRGRCLPYGEQTGYGAFSQVLKQAVGLGDGSGAADAVDVVRRRVRELLPDADAASIAADLATLMGITGASGAEKHALFLSARRFLAALATPTLLIIEDIHWADPTLLELVESLASRTRDAPLLVLTLARPELLDRSPRWGAGVPAYTALTMSPLSDDDACRLAALHLGLDGPSPTAVRLAAMCDGNPLFIEELSVSVVEQATDVESALPTNVRAIIAARLDALPPDERAVLLDAAVIGKVFWQGALARRHPDVGAVLDALDRRDLIRREVDSQLDGELEFTFRHMLIREVAYATLARAARQHRHAEAARFLEETTGDRSLEWATTLAHHWREAGERDRAVEYLVAAARRAGDAWAAAEATQLYSDALELLDDDDPRRGALRLARGMLLVQSAYYAEGASDLDAVLPGLEGPERAEALLARGTAGLWLMDAHLARRYGDEALAMAREVDDALVGPALSVVANAGAIDGDLAGAMELQRRSLAAWQPGTRPRHLADHLGMMALTAYWVGEHDKAIELARQSYDLGVEHQSVAALLQGGSHLALALTGRGRLDEAIELFEKVIATGRELEAKPRLTSRTMNMLATALREVGDDAGARLLNEEALERAQQADFGAAYSQGIIDLVFADLQEGAIGRAEERWRTAKAAVDALAGWHQWLGLGRLTLARAEIALVAGDAAGALDYGEQATRSARRVGRRKYEALGRLAVARALVHLGRPVDAMAELEMASSLADVIGHPATSWRVDAGMAAALASAGREREAAARVAKVRDGFEALNLSDARHEQLLGSQLVRRVERDLPAL